jgi:hypothetical protein
MVEKWLDAPTVSGIYWAYRQKGTNNRPSACKVTLLAAGEWKATFLGGVETYRFKMGQGWQWQLAAVPDAPRKVVVA